MASEESEVALSIDRIVRQYGSNTAIDGVSLTVREGEFFTLVGPSGSGKTTMLRLIAGLEEANAGSVNMFGRDVTGVPPEERNVGLVFQDYALFPTMTVAENVGYGLNFVDSPKGMSRTDRIAAMLDLVDLAGFEDRSIDQLSGGQQQRVALARALAPAPDILLLDEPLSALDAQLREQLRRTIKSIQRELGITTVYVTHDQAEALAISDRIAVLNEGSCEQVATPQELYRTPQTQFVAEFIGENTVFSGTVTEVGTRIAQLEIGGSEVRVAIDRGLSRDITPGDEITCSIAASMIQRHGGATKLSCEVMEIEFLGDYYRVHADWKSHAVTIHSDDPIEGTIEVGVDPEAIHVVSIDR